MTLGATIRIYWRILRPYKRLFAFVLLVNVSVALLFGVADPVFHKYLIDSLAQRRVDVFLLVMVLSVVIATGVRWLGYVSSVTTQRLKNALCRDGLTETFVAFYRLPYPEVAARDRGYFASRIYDEPAQATSDIVDSAAAILRAAVTCIGAFAVTVWLSWQVTLAVTVIVPILVGLSRRYSGRIAAAAQQGSEEEAALRDGLGRAVDGYKAVHLFDLYSVVRAKVGALLDAFLSTQLRRTRYSAGFQTTSAILLSYAEIVVMIAAGVQVLRGELTIGGLFGFTGAYWRLVNAFSTLLAQVPIVAELSGRLARIEGFVAAPGPQAAPSPGRGVEIRNASFGYGDRSVLADLDLQVRGGERVLITGRNGSGKSTLAHILTGFLEVEQGEARLPGRDRTSAVLLPFGFVPGTLKDNLGFDQLPEAKQRIVHDLAERFGIADKLDRDPASLSQGEQRKFQVVMALLKDADVYVFDEPLSNVDVDSKDAVMEAIFAQTQGRGLVVIMHGDSQYRDAFGGELRLGSTQANLAVPIRPHVDAPGPAPAGSLA